MIIFMLIVFLTAVIRTITALSKKENRTIGQIGVIVINIIAYIILLNHFITLKN